MRYCSALFCLTLFVFIGIQRPGQSADPLLDAYFQKEAARQAERCLKDIKSPEDWEKKKPELRRQFLDMLGLWPLPPRTELKATVTGVIDSNLFTVEKLHYQSLPGLYVTANFYLPKNRTHKCPAILYMCGHSQVIENNVSYGCKVAYQHHGIWFAEHGYACLIVDTLQLGEIQGIHHGTYNRGMWYWHSLAYSPAGIECWNAIRALDYLESRPEVDAKKIGATGRSGGGAATWWIGAADDRPQCLVPVAGIADMEAHIVQGEMHPYEKGIISGHCDCMYMVNTYQWDFPAVAALCAPRPVLLGNSDHDSIFPQSSYRRLSGKVRRVYEILSVPDRFLLMETAGPHEDTPELRLGAYRWMNRWLKNDSGEVSERKPKLFTPQQLKVFKELPADAINARIQEFFIKRPSPQLPSSPQVASEWWKGQRALWLKEVEEQVFSGWPSSPPPLKALALPEVVGQGLRLRAFDFTSEENVPLRVWLVTADTVDKPTAIFLSVVDEDEWNDWIKSLPKTFQASAMVPKPVKTDENRLQQLEKTLAFNKWGFATIAVRGIGPNRYQAPGTADETHIKRRLALLGRTLDGQRVWDVRRALTVLRDQAQFKDVPFWIQGRETMGGIALYAALFEPAVAGVELWHPPASHATGPYFLGVLRILDMPQAVALMFPRTVKLYLKGEEDQKNWTWPMELQKALGNEALRIRDVGN